MPRTKTLRKEGNQRIVQCGTRAIWEEKKGSKWMVVGAYFTDDKPGMAKMFQEFDMTIKDNPKPNPMVEKNPGLPTPRGGGPTRTDLAMVASGQWTKAGKRHFRHVSGVELKPTKVRGDRGTVDGYVIAGGKDDGLSFEALWVARDRVEKGGNPKKKDRSSEPKSGRFSKKASALFAKGADKVNRTIQETARGKNPCCPGCGNTFKNPIEPGKWTCSGCGAQVEVK